MQQLDRPIPTGAVHKAVHQAVHTAVDRAVIRINNICDVIRIYRVVYRVEH